VRGMLLLLLLLLVHTSAIITAVAAANPECTGGRCLCTYELNRDYQAPGSKCPHEPCADLGGAGHSVQAEDEHACCQACATYAGPELCRYGVWQPGSKRCYLKADPANPVPGNGEVGMILVGVPPSRWGWEFLLMFSLCGVVYVAGGLVLSRRTRGQLGGGGGALASHPHYHLWRELHSLCTDGAALMRGSGGQRRPALRSSSSSSSSRPTPVDYGATRTGRKQQVPPQRAEKSSKKEKKAQRERRKAGKSGPAADESPGSPLQNSNAGRWVHIPG
jgi:hypothetical protein